MPTNGQVDIEIPYVDDEAMAPRVSEDSKVQAAQVAVLETMLAALRQMQQQPNGRSWFKDWIPVGMTALLLTGTMIRYDATRETTSTITIKELQNQVTDLSQKISKLETWDEKVRNNFAAQGVIVDKDTGEIKLVFPSKGRK